MAAAAAPPALSAVLLLSCLFFLPSSNKSHTRSSQIHSQVSAPLHKMPPRPPLRAVSAWVGSTLLSYILAVEGEAARRKLSTRERPPLTNVSTIEILQSLLGRARQAVNASLLFYVLMSSTIPRPKHRGCPDKNETSSFVFACCLISSFYPRYSPV